MKGREIVIALYLECNGDWDLMYKHIKERILPDATASVTKTAEFRNLCNSDNVITILDSNYPNELKASHKPPFVLVQLQERSQKQ